MQLLAATTADGGGVLVTLVNRDTSKPHAQTVQINCKGTKPLATRANTTLLRAQLPLAISSKFLREESEVEVSGEGVISFNVPTYSILQAFVPFAA